ncbi:nitrite reductase [Massilia sp. METH4]|uniref:XAC2610-related protein n=1 Tax=Massilia sp. METH4 TaxID=3123041 RepID=UPI0030D0ED8B
MVMSVWSLWFLSTVQVAHAGEPGPVMVEFPAWSRTYAGNLDGRQVEVALTRVDARVEGSYCFAPCARDGQDRIQMQGTVKGDRIRLSELRLGERGTRVRQASWHARLRDGHMVGSRAHPDSGAAQRFSLADTRPLPYEMTLVADSRPANDHTCETQPRVVAIKLYRGRRLVQRLATDSQGTCQVFLPRAIDANFDGRPDITIPLFLPASPNIPHQTWLFDPRTRRFAPGPELLQEITSPEYDYEHKMIASFWRDGCCSHGVTTYRWHGSTLVEDQTLQSHALPVLADDGKRRYCYSSPSYIDGQIVFKDRVEEREGRLAFTVADVGACEESYGIARDTRIDIWQRGPGGALRIARTETVHWRPVLDGGQTHYCPEVPFFDHGSIVRILLDGDERALCTDEQP